MKERSSLLENSRVSAGTYIGMVGNTGNSDGAHLDLRMGDAQSITVNNSINPQRFFPSVEFTNKVSTVAP